MAPRPEKQVSSRPGQVRIIGGAWRGRRLSVAPSEGLRPTPDRVRETLFNWLQPVIAGARCLDLFAGTGVLGLECLSRGGSEAVLVEKDAQAARVLSENVLRLQARTARVVEADALAYLEGTPTAFDLVFLDPPFQSAHIEKAAGLLRARGWIRPGGLIYIEAPKGAALTLPARWREQRAKTAGEVAYYLVRAD